MIQLSFVAMNKKSIVEPGVGWAAMINATRQPFRWSNIKYLRKLTAFVLSLLDEKVIGASSADKSRFANSKLANFSHFNHSFRPQHRRHRYGKMKNRSVCAPLLVLQSFPPQFTCHTTSARAED